MSEKSKECETFTILAGMAVESDDLERAETALKRIRECSNTTDQDFAGAASAAAGFGLAFKGISGTGCTSTGFFSDFNCLDKD